LDRSVVAAGLREIGARLRLSGENPFRARAYETGARAVDQLSGDELRRRLSAGTLTEVAGIGQALAGIISELARTGQAAVLTRLRAAAPAALLELSRLPGLSTKRARGLHDALGVSGIDELAEAARAGRVRDVRGFGPKTEMAIVAAIDAYRARPKALRLSDARQAIATLMSFVETRPGVSMAEVAGGVRRWEEIVDELTVVAVREGREMTIDAIAGFPPFARVEERGPDCIVGRLVDGVRVRVRVVPRSSRGLALIEETGPSGHLEALRLRAQERGLTWDALVAPDEMSVYAALDLPLVPPEARGSGPLPSCSDLDALVTASDLRGMIHCHTTYSDGRHTIEEMARAADARGVEYMTITDHSPTASYAGGLTADRLEQQWDEIARVQETVKVRLLRGTESDILADGGLDYPDAVLEHLDVIIASIHGRYRMDAAAMTVRLERAMRLPLFKIWGHALGRLILRREPIACDVEGILDAVAASRAAIEISGDPYRLDLPPAWIPAARQRGIPFVISTDAHSTSDFDNLVYGVAMARRGGIRRDEVLNTLPVAIFRAAVHP
jgi:DNA polymerase (family 10)